ncbi:MAG: hypothetical protein GY765_24455 [bacterium]|nr:hypothetical protein [bacterium]
MTIKKRKQRRLHNVTAIWVCLTTLTASFLLVLWAVRGNDPHDFEGKCNLCHVGLKNPTILTKEIDYLCLSCHKDSAKRSHPSGIVPAKELPAKYPLFRGKMACTTCHFPHAVLNHADSAPEPGRNVPGPYFLRAQSVGRVFCYSCHRGGFTSTSVDSHAISIKRAHTGSTQLDFQQNKMIDDNSRECLSCHDGTISSHTDTEIRSLSWEHRKDIGMSHPISFEYEAVYFKKPREYHAPQSLDKRITLINGKVGCETCHNHYSKHKKHLVMDNRGSKLCLSCHNL